jgi:glycosyltransferase involved in cell wall biosynthesis
LIDRLDAHAERSRRLFWLDDAADDELDAIYAASAALLATSWGEGYGLPLIEAAQRGLPVIARDIPVFREVMRNAATYVIAPTAQDLAQALGQWLAAPTSPQPVTSITWNESASALAHLILAANRQVQG